MLTVNMFRFHWMCWQPTKADGKMGWPIIILNLALTSQLVAPAGGNAERIADLQKAIKLYDLPFNMVYQDHFNECNSLYILAVVMNMGLTHEHLDNAKMAGK
jgi:hypothetical protein